MSADHDHNPIPRYLAVFNFLVAVTAFELLPLFGLMDIPAPLLLALSAIKFTVVVLFFMHVKYSKTLELLVAINAGNMWYPLTPV